jgi:hypothetical protein
MHRYKQCYDESTNGFDEVYTREKGVNRDDRVHGSLLVLNELLRCSNAEWERSYEELMDRVQYQQGQQANVSFCAVANILSHQGFVSSSCESNGLEMSVKVELHCIPLN